jgi:hypothetical protein
MFSGILISSLVARINTRIAYGLNSNALIVKVGAFFYLTGKV